MGRRNPWERDCTWETDRLLCAKCIWVTCQKGGQTVALILMSVPSVLLYHLPKTCLILSKEPDRLIPTCSSLLTQLRIYSPHNNMLNNTLKSLAPLAVFSAQPCDKPPTETKPVPNSAHSGLSHRVPLHRTPVGWCPTRERRCPVSNVPHHCPGHRLHFPSQLTLHSHSFPTLFHPFPISSKPPASLSLPSM